MILLYVPNTCFVVMFVLMEFRITICFKITTKHVLHKENLCVNSTYCNSWDLVFVCTEER